MRLDKAVSLAGVSRKDAKKILASGRVSVNGKPEKSGSFLLAPGDTVALDGTAIRLKTHVHIMIHKPAGCLTATEDPRGEQTVLDLVPASMRARDLGPIGRLDKDVTGLVILTTDGQLAHRLISPKRGIEKQYTARVEGQLTEAAVRAFAEGMDLGDFETRPARLEILEAFPDHSLCRVYITEGKFHQVKRMLEKAGCPVTALSRQRVAGLTLDEDLPLGKCRYLTEQEEALLYAAAGMEVPE